MNSATTREGASRPATPALGRVSAESVAGALERALDAEARRVSKGHPRSGATALALSAAPHWDGPDTLTVQIETGQGTNEQRSVRVVGADSVLTAATVPAAD